MGLENTNEFVLDTEYSKLIYSVYRRYNYLKLSREDYIQDLIIYLQKEDIDLTSSTIDKNKLLSKIDKFFVNLIKSKLSNEEDSLVIVNNYIDKYFSYNGTYNDALKNLERLNNFFNKFSFFPNNDFCNNLIDCNSMIKSMILEVFDKNKDIISNGDIEGEFDNALIIIFIEAYCSKNGIIINQSDNIDDYLNKGSYFDEFMSDSKSDINYDTLIYQEMRKYPLLKAEEERELLIKYHETKDKKYSDILVERNLRLVAKRASKFVNRGLEEKDLLQEGVIGLMTAIDDFDINVKGRLSTYAVWWIDQKIRRATQDKGRNIRIPVHLHEKIATYKRISKMLENKLNREPTTLEIAKEMKIDEEEANELYEYMFDTISLNIFVGKDKDTEFGDFILEPTTEFEDDVIDTSALSDQIYEIIDSLKLKDRDREVIIRRFGLDGKEPETLEEIGLRYDVTRERIRQCEAKVLRKLRLPHNKKKLESWAEDIVDLDREREVPMGAEKLTLEEYLNKNRENPYSDEEIKNAVAELTDEEKELIVLRYSDGKMNKQQMNKFYGCVIPKLQRLLNKKGETSGVRKERSSNVDTPKVEESKVKEKETEDTLKSLLCSDGIIYFDYEINEMRKKLSDKENKIVAKRYTKGKKLTEKEQNLFDNEIVPKMKYLLKNPAVIVEANDKGSSKVKTLKEYLNRDDKKYSDEEIELMLSKLSDKHRNIVELKFSGQRKLSEEEKKSFWSIITPRMKKLLENPDMVVRPRRNTLKGYLNSGNKEYSDEEIELMLSKLTEEDRRITNLKFDDESQLSVLEQKRFRQIIAPKMKSLLENPDEAVMIRATTLKEYLNKGDRKYSDEEIELMLSKLDEEDRRIINIRFEDDSKLTLSEYKDFYNNIVPRMKRILEKQNRHSQTFYEYINTGEKKYSTEEIDAILSEFSDEDRAIIEKKFQKDSSMTSYEKGRYYYIITMIKKKLKNPGEKTRTRAKTLREYLNKGNKKYSDEEIDVMLSKLSEQDRRIVELKFMNDRELTKTEYNRFINYLAPKMKSFLENPDREFYERKTVKKENTVIEKGSSVDEVKKEDEKGNNVDSSLIETQEIQPNKEDYIKLLELLRTSTFGDMMKYLTVKEAIIVSLKLGYVDGKYFSTESIANFLGIDNNEVRETTKKALLMYQDSFVSMIDKAIDVVTDNADKHNIVKTRKND